MEALISSLQYIIKETDNPNLDGYFKCPFCKKLFSKDNTNHFCVNNISGTSWAQINHKYIRSNMYILFIFNK